MGLSFPWDVVSVVFDEATESVLVRVELADRSGLLCPVCDAPCPRYDRGTERRWRHLDSCGFQTFLVAQVPRVQCSEHGVSVISVPWSEPKARFTLEFERFAIVVLQKMKSQSRAASLLRLSPGQVRSIMHRAVERGLARRVEEPVPALSVDEKSFHHRHYVSVLTDLERGRVIDVCEDRTSEAVVELIQSTLTPAQRQGVRSVTMDMWDGFIKAARTSLPGADIVFDRFHIARYLGEAVNQTRLIEHRQLTASGNSSLKGSKFFWLARAETMNDSVRKRYGHLAEMNLKTAKAWSLKENFRSYFGLTDTSVADAFFRAWKEDVDAGDNHPMKRVAKMLARYYYGLQNYIRHRTTNSKAEGTNALIQEVKFAARGFRTFQGFRIAILFFLGKLDLNPLKTP